MIRNVDYQFLIAAYMFCIQVITYIKYQGTVSPYKMSMYAIIRLEKNPRIDGFPIKKSLKKNLSIIQLIIQIFLVEPFSSIYVGDETLFIVCDTLNLCCLKL